MPEPDLFLLFVEPLNRAGIAYMVTGAVASLVYGEPRMTHDVDLVVALEASRVDDFIAVFPPDRFYCPPQEVIRTEIAREARGHFNLIHHATGFKADIYPVGQDPLHTWAMARRRSFPVEGTQVWMAPPEYVILRKLQYFQEGGSPKHVRDIQRILDISGESIDRVELNGKILELGLQEVWKQVQRES